MASENKSRTKYVPLSLVMNLFHQVTEHSMDRINDGNVLFSAIPKKILRKQKKYYCLVTTPVSSSHVLDILMLGTIYSSMAIISRIISRYRKLLLCNMATLRAPDNL